MRAASQHELRNLKGLVIGGGSIGRRHLQNLKSLGVDRLGVVEIDAPRRECLISELCLAAFPNMSAGLEWAPNFVVVATPTYLHAEQALLAVRGGFDVFVEKPLSHNSERLTELCDLIERRNLVSLVGCNMRFHPGPKVVKELLQQEITGRILFSRLQCGSYLPDWRPSTDYRDNYAARETTGGGCILDCVHEIDLARWYLGEVQEVICLTANSGSLEITTEDVAALICRHHCGALSEIHLDYLQRTPERSCQIVGEQGSIVWDINSHQVRWYDANSGQWTAFSEPEPWQPNQMYLDEMSHFLDCVRTRRATTLPIPEAIHVMQIAFAAKTSARAGRMVSTGREVVA